MLMRCENKNHIGYKRYGGRGIKVCKRWHKFENFFADMGPRPPGLTLERKNNNRGYCPSNCEWATPKQQARNRHGNFVITAFGRTQTLQAWADETGIGNRTLTARIRELGWAPEKAFTTPVAWQNQR